LPPIPALHRIGALITGQSLLQDMMPFYDEMELATVYLA
jgi:hypothetical protein